MRKSLLIEGETSISGVIQRVGGASKTRCALRVPFQHNLLYCRVASRKLARELGQHLYRDVVAQGKATWLKTTWRLRSFEIRGVRPLRSGSLSEIFDTLHEAGGKGWDTIDNPEEFLEEISGER